MKIDSNGLWHWFKVALWFLNSSARILQWSIVLSISFCANHQSADIRTFIPLPVTSGGGRQIFPNLISTHYSWWFDFKILAIDFQSILSGLMFHFSLSPGDLWNSWFRFVVDQSWSWVRKQKSSENMDRYSKFVRESFDFVIVVRKT